MMSCARSRGIGLLLLVLLLLSAVVPPLRAQESTPDPVLSLMERMSPEARVGQLVLVTYPGVVIDDDSEIVGLVEDYGIGGVLLRPQNGNFGSSGLSGSELLSITTQLQTAAWVSSQTLSTPSLAEPEAGLQSPFVPLLIGTQAADAGTTPSEFVIGATDLPTPMALGAAWDPELAKAVGAVLGGELAAVGVNLYLGPDLDVLYTPRPGDAADLGPRAFGADPFWVGELGTAYIAGLHEGSASRLLVIPRHLPGLGSADRPLEDEVPTVQKPLEQLKQIELAPFFAASRGLPGVAMDAADGFLVTHIRYRGFQGNNIRRTTRPISLDAPALQLVTSLKEVLPWREAGGLLVADNLGLASVHLSYDPTGQTFNARRVLQDALSAGNDLLILDRFAPPEGDYWAAHFANVRDTLGYLATRYQDESTFRAIVDQAVYRVLSAKLRLYSEFALDTVLEVPSERPTEGDVAGATVVSQVALAALTRIYPLSDDLLPPPPQEGETLVVFTQESRAGGTPMYGLDGDSVSEAILRFYGPEGTGVVSRSSVQGFTYGDLMEGLAQPGVTVVEEGEAVTTAVAVNRALQSADWILFAATGLRSDDDVAAGALKRFLATQANLLDARIAVLSFGPPYELDTTEISKLAVYYGLYSTGDAFVEAGVRAVFQDLLAPGASPVDIPALGYYIPQQMMPDPAQTIALAIVDERGEELSSAARASIHVGDVINVQTGVVVDGNGRVVPDGTPVQFLLNYRQEGSRNTVIGETIDGVATAAVTLERVGELDLLAQSEPAVSSVRLELTIRDDGVTITEVEPTPTPTLAPTVTPTEAPTAMPTINPIPTKAGQLPGRPSLPRPARLSLIGWALVSAATVSTSAFLMKRERSLAADRAFAVALVGAIGGLVGYIALMAIARWWLPVVRYALVGREYLAAVVSAGCGLAACLVAGLTVGREGLSAAPRLLQRSTEPRGPEGQELSPAEPRE